MIIIKEQLEDGIIQCHTQIFRFNTEIRTIDYENDSITIGVYENKARATEVLKLIIEHINYWAYVNATGDDTENYKYSENYIFEMPDK